MKTIQPDLQNVNESPAIDNTEAEMFEWKERAEKNLLRALKAENQLMQLKSPDASSEFSESSADSAMIWDDESYKLYEVEQNMHLPPVVVGAAASPCLILTNIFVLTDEIQKPNLKNKMRAEVIKECSKFGCLVHINIDDTVPEVNISIKFSTEKASLLAIAGLNGRNVFGNRIQAEIVPISVYHKLFPESINMNQVLEPSM
jgi:hypothetical protein